MPTCALDASTHVALRPVLCKNLLASGYALAALHSYLGGNLLFYGAVLLTLLVFLSQKRSFVRRTFYCLLQ
jgi:hypothetical protein